MGRGLRGLCLRFLLSLRLIRLVVLLDPPFRLVWRQRQDFSHERIKPLELRGRFRLGRHTHILAESLAQLRLCPNQRRIGCF